MVLRILALLVVALTLLGLGWRYGRTVAALVQPAEHRPANIVFDNGTVRQPPVPASAVQAAAPLAGPGGMRKCRRGNEVVYTQDACPPGMKPQAMSGGTVNVVGSGAQARPADAQAGQAQPRGSALDVMDRGEAGSLRDKRIERVTSP